MSNSFTSSDSGINDLDFDAMVGHITTKEGYAAFEGFLEIAYAADQLRFWAAVNDLRTKTEQADINKTAEEIYKTYLAKKCPREISVINQNKKKIIVAHAEKGEWSVGMFDSIYHECEKVLLDFWKTKYKASKHYTTWLTNKHKKRTEKGIFIFFIIRSLNLLPS